MRYAHERHAFGQPIFAHQAVAFRLADGAASLEAARQLTLLGYRNVKVLKGGWFKWVELKYKTERKDEKKDAK